MENIFKRIKSLQIQGATAIAAESLKYLKKFSAKNGFGKKFDAECKRLLAVRKTAVVLHNVLEELKKEKSAKKIDELLERLQKNKEKIAFNGRSLIKKNYSVHTHCHSTEALAVIKEAAKTKKFAVVVDETRPKGQGIKTAKELAKIRKIKVTLIIDDAAWNTVQNDDIVIVGADALRKEGLVNKIGTHMLAVIAKEKGIPFYVAADTFRLDRRKKIEIEERPPEEIHKKIKGVKIKNPAFDITPWKYVMTVITEKGIKKPKNIVKMIIKK